MRAFWLIVALMGACGPKSGGAPVVENGGGSGSGTGTGTGTGTGPEVVDAGSVAPDAAEVAAAPPDAPPARKPPPPKTPAKVVQINAPGELIDIAKSVPGGYVTIVDFWATWCGGCKVMEAKFMEKIGDNPRVLVRKVDVGDGDTPVAKHYGVHGLPQIWLYDAKRQLRYVLVANDALKTGDLAIELAK
jgi:thiol-disulfide isomerase/thioredoxin